MRLNTSQRIVATIVLAMFVGCQTGTKQAAAKADVPKTDLTASNSAKASPQQPTPPVGPPARIAAKEHTGPKVRTAFYGADTKPTAMPHVLLSKGDAAACKVKVGDAMPAIELPKLGETNKTKLTDLLGKKATVVVFWKGDRRMSQQQLADIGKDIVEPFGKQGVTVVGVTVDDSEKDAAATFKKSGATFTNLHDADGKAFAQVGTGRFPRTYLLDPSGKIVWFDIEYSLATRRELHQALRVVAGDK
jgi:peroxiredoxin